MATSTKTTTTTIAGLYDLQETLGKGHFAVVKAARHVFTNERVAVKVIDKSRLDDSAAKALLKEVLCMKLVQHQNVVRLYEVIDTERKLFLILELGRGDLWDLVVRKNLPEPAARHYFVQIFEAVSYCHRLHVVHRDLKPENVVYFPSGNDSLGEVKLTDFGFSNNYAPGEKLATSCGSLAYSAPEILLGDAYDAPAVDIWSLGVLLFTLATGHPPFQEANDSETLTMIMDVKYKIPENVSINCADLIRGMLLRHPPSRLTIPQIEAHPWIRNHVRKAVQPLINRTKLSLNERGRIIEEMVRGGVVGSEEDLMESLTSNAYNHVTSSYYLLAERLLREKKNNGGGGGAGCHGDEEGEEVKNITSSLESLNKSSNYLRRVSVTEEEVEPPPTTPPTTTTPPQTMLVSTSHSSGLSRFSTKKFSPILKNQPEMLEESTAAVAMETNTKKKSKKSLFFSWLFKRHSLTPSNNNNNLRIYKTRSCSELGKIKFNV